MIIKFTEVVYCEEWDFERLVRDSGYAHEVDVEDLTAKVWYNGHRELLLSCEIDTETGKIVVTSGAS
jgi:hypothetical protein